MTAEIQQYQNEPYCLDVEESIQASFPFMIDLNNTVQDEILARIIFGKTQPKVGLNISDFIKSYVT